MPFDALCVYLENKYDRECYELDCQWSRATGSQFIESNAPKEPQKYVTKATLPRWYEYHRTRRPQQKQEEQDVFSIIDAIANGG